MAECGCLLPPFLRVARTAEYGRGIYAEKELSAGVDLLVSHPLVHVTPSNQRGLYCDWCISKTENLQKCGQCKFVRYCSRNCQRLDWSLHKFECKGIARISPKVPTDTVRLIVKLLMKRNTKSDLNLPEGVEWDLDVLTTHAARYNEELKQSLSEQVLGAKLLASTPDGSGPHFDIEMAFKIACKIVSNSFSILDWEMNSIGSGIYIVPALFNHSCDPNCIAIFDGYKMRLRTIREVKQNEQLFVSYTDLLDTRERRRRHLQKYYLFHCTCTRCSEEYKDSLDQKLISTSIKLSDSESKALYKEGFSKLEDAEKLKKSSEWERLLDMSLNYVKENISKLDNTNILIIKMRECVMDSCIELGKWKQALDVSHPLREAYEIFYRLNNPFLGLHYFKMAKLMQQVSEDTESLRESLKLLDKAVGILSITHGSTHCCVQEGQGIIYDTGMELSLRESMKKK